MSSRPCMSHPFRDVGQHSFIVVYRQEDCMTLWPRRTTFVRVGWAPARTPARHTVHTIAAIISSIEGPDQKMTSSSSRFNTEADLVSEVLATGAEVCGNGGRSSSTWPQQPTSRRSGVSTGQLPHTDALPIPLPCYIPVPPLVVLPSSCFPGPFSAGKTPRVPAHPAHPAAAIKSHVSTFTPWHADFTEP